MIRNRYGTSVLFSVLTSIYTGQRCSAQLAMAASGAVNRYCLRRRRFRLQDEQQDDPRHGPSC